MHRSLTIVAIAGSGMFASNTIITAETISVCTSGCDYTSIQDAIDAASEGDVIQLADETYTEGSTIRIDKAVTLIGSTASDGFIQTILDGGDSHRVLEYTGPSGGVLANLVVRNGSAGHPGGGGLHVADTGLFTELSVKNCIFHSNEVSNGTSGGGALVEGGTVVFEEVSFTENGGGLNDAVNGGGLAISGDSGVVFYEPHFFGNLAQIGGGLYVGENASINIWYTKEVTDNWGFYENTAYWVEDQGSGDAEPGRGGAIAVFGSMVMLNDVARPRPDGQGLVDQVFMFKQNSALSTEGVPGLGGGIYTETKSGPQYFISIQYTSWLQNNAGNGGGVYVASNPGNDTYIEHSSFIENTADNGGGLCANAPGNILAHNTFTGNSPNGIADAGTDGLTRGGQPIVLASIESCTIYGNGDGDNFEQIRGLVIHQGDNHISKAPPLSDCPSDINGDGQVDAADLGLLIGAWGFCF